MHLDRIYLWRGDCYGPGSSDGCPDNLYIAMGVMPDKDMASAGATVTPDMSPEREAELLNYFNTGNVTGIRAMPGVGYTSAKKIIAERPFTSLADLEEKCVITLPDLSAWVAPDSAPATGEAADDEPEEEEPEEDD